MHPILLAVYPVLHLLSANIAQVAPRAALGPLIVALLAGMVLWPLCGLVLRSPGKGALWASSFWVLFYAHGHVLGLLGGGRVAAWILMAAGAAAWAALGLLLRRWQGESARWNRVVDVPAVVLTLLAVGPILAQAIKPPTNLPATEGAAEEAAEISAPLGYLPDIYVIVLDAFGRADMLEEIYDVDLSGLIEHLESRGFVVPGRSRANYAQTGLSLASFFNSAYMDELMPKLRPGAEDDGALRMLTRKNRAVTRLREAGYRVVTLTGGSELAVLDDPDVNYRGGALNEFQSGVLATTPLPLFAGLFGGGAEVLDPYAQHRASVKWQLAKLPYVQAPAGPKFVFAHILTPHPPFVIGPDGEDLRPTTEFSLRERAAWDGYVEGYAGQATWLASGALQKTVDGILAASRRPPVVVIMGDHGPASRWLASWRRTGSFRTTDPGVMAERMANFLAILLPLGEGPEPYPTITPVNVFPMVFARIFGDEFAPREDRSYFSTYEEWATFRDVDRMSRAKRLRSRR